jgi:hypothetical protein
MDKKDKRPFLKKADTTALDKYNCGNCNKFQTRWCPFVGQASEPTAETRACEHFDKSYTVQVENTDHKGVSTIRQEENLYKHYEAPKNLQVAKDENEPFSHACGQCEKFGTIHCPYLEKSSEARACQAFAIKAPEGEDQIKVQNIDYDALVYDIPRENYHIHPEINSLRDLVEYEFPLKAVYPQPFRVANDNKEVKTARLTEQEENALNTFILGFKKIESSGLIQIKTVSIDATFYETNHYVLVMGILKQDPELQIYYRMTKELEPDRALALVDSTTEKVLDATIMHSGEDVTFALHKMIQKAMEKTASNKILKKNHKTQE